MGKLQLYQRYSIPKEHTPPIVRHPHPFKVKIRRFALLKLLVKELIAYWGQWRVVGSRPCAYGVFSGPVGGFIPRERLCVGCMRCTVQYPDISRIERNPQFQALATDEITAGQIDTIMEEAASGNAAVKGAGYRGKFGGKGWDAIWTDMSEIVRPTRDGIYGREFISTEVNLGGKPSYLSFDGEGQVVGELPQTVDLCLPMLFDLLPEKALAHPHVPLILAQVADQLRTVAILPLDILQKHALSGPHLVPHMASDQWSTFKGWKSQPRLIELSDWNSDVYQEMRRTLPGTQIMLRCGFETDLAHAYNEGVRLFHLSAPDSQHLRMFDLIRRAHLQCVEKGVRDTLSLVGSGGFFAAEHVPKGLLAGLNAVALSTPLIIALQGPLQGEKAFQLPKNMSVEWGVQRLYNLMGAWQDQLFEFAGAMGLRETQRMCGEVGRALFQKELEKEAFGKIEGYEQR